MNWYVKRGESERGPFTESDLFTALRERRLKRETLVRPEADANGWRALGDVALKVKLLPSRNDAALRTDLEDERALMEIARPRFRILAWSGAAISIAGSLVTYDSYRSAATLGHSHYTVYSGAIVAGVLMCLRGLRGLGYKAAPASE